MINLTARQEAIKNLYIEFIKEHEAAHNRHELAVHKYENEVTEKNKAEMLYLGSYASMTGGRLEGLVTALIIMAIQEAEDEI